MVVSSAGLRRRAELTTPSATNRKGSILLMSRTPLLCEEGNVLPRNFVQKRDPIYRAEQGVGFQPD